MQLTLGLIVLITLLDNVIINGFRSFCALKYVKRVGGVNRTSKYENRHSMITLYMGFDEDFASAMSKPLPDWYKEQQEARENYERELEEYRASIAEEFRKKHEKTECVLMYDKEGNIVDSDGSNVYKGISKTNSENLISSRYAEDEKDEEEATGFYLPGFFEVFPELKLKWPKWARKRDGGAIECETDRDCLFPQACCNHPIIPGKKFCCTGMGQRIMEPAYVGQEIQGDVAMGRKVGENDRPEDPPGTPKEPWRPDPNLNGY